MRRPAPSRVPAWTILAGLIAVSTALRGYAGLKVHGPWISPDETVYALLGQGLYRHASLTILGGPTPFYSLVVPALVGPFLSIHDLELGYSLLKPFLALVMSLAAVPVYLWARPLAGRGSALAAAALTLALPGLAYSGLVMSEVAFYPALTLAAFATARAIAVPTRGRALLLGVAVALAAATRLQALALLPVVVGAVVLDAVFARSRARLRECAPVLIAAVAPVVAWLVIQQLRGEPALGAYESTASASYHAVDAVRFVLYHAGTLVLTTGVVPACVVLALGIGAALRGERDPLARATIATTLALCVGVTVQVGVFASQHVGQLAERDLLAVVPSMFVCVALWLRRETRGRAVAVAAAALAFAAVALLPLGTFVTEAELPDGITFAPLWHFELATSVRTLELVVLVAAGTVATLFVVLPRRARPALVTLLLAIGVAGSVASSREVITQAQRARTTLVGPDPRWADDANSFGAAAFLYDGGTNWPEVWQALFWNRRLHHVVTVGGVVVPGPLPQASARLNARGRIDVAEPQIVTPSTYQVQGSLIALSAQSIPEQAGLRLWEFTPPPRIVARAFGLEANGDVYGNLRGTLLVYGCVPGTWTLTLLPKEPPQDVVLTQDGHVLRRLHLAHDAWSGELPVSPRPGSHTCVLGVSSSLVVGTTRFEFAPATAS